MADVCSNLTFHGVSQDLQLRLQGSLPAKDYDEPVAGVESAGCLLDSMISALNPLSKLGRSNRTSLNSKTTILSGLCTHRLVASWLWQGNRLGTPFGPSVEAADAYERDLCNFVDALLACLRFRGRKIHQFLNKEKPSSPGFEHAHPRVEGFEPGTEWVR